MSVKKTNIEDFVKFNLQMVEIRERSHPRKRRNSFVSALIRHLPLKKNRSQQSRKKKKSA